MSAAIQELINGLGLGSTYALVAFGFTMVFGVLELIAFAQGGVFMVGAFIGLAVGNAIGADAGWLVGLLGASLAAVLGAGVLNVMIDRVAYRPLRNAGRLAPLVSGIGVYIFFENSAGVWIGNQPQVYPALLPGAAFTIGGVHITAAECVLFVAAALCTASLWGLVSRTAIGLKMRAVAERPRTAALMGVDAERVIMFTFFIGGAYAGIAGVLVGAYGGVATPTMGFLVSIKAFAAAVIGGIGNIRGALLGGLVIGLVETFAASYIASAWADAIVFIVLIAVLVLRPHGLLGMRVPDRA